MIIDRVPSVNTGMTMALAKLLLITTTTVIILSSSTVGVLAAGPTLSSDCLVGSNSCGIVVSRADVIGNSSIDDHRQNRSSLKPSAPIRRATLSPHDRTDHYAVMASAQSYFGSEWAGDGGDGDQTGQWLPEQYRPWLCSLLASLAIGLSGVLPLLVIPDNARSTFNKPDGSSKTLRLLLSFAVGGLLGDVFLHLLPEAWQHMQSVGATDHGSHMACGLWVLAGIFTFIVIEMMFDKDEAADVAPVGGASQISCTCCGPPIRYLKDGNGAVSNGNGAAHRRNGSSKKSHTKVPRDDHNGNIANGLSPTRCSTTPSNGHSQHHSSCDHSHRELAATTESRHITGYLNLLANSIDNFAHGLAVAGSFLVSFKVGMLTTFAILIHEIPHEIGDFAILLKAGFNRYDAAKAQIATAAVGMAGAIAALSAESTQTLGNRTAWILPFTAGGFLNIALVNVLPDIMSEKNPKESFKQLMCLIGGVGVMAGVTILFG